MKTEFHGGMFIEAVFVFVKTNKQKKSNINVLLGQNAKLNHKTIDGNG